MSTIQNLLIGASKAIIAVQQLHQRRNGYSQSPCRIDRARLNLIRRVLRSSRTIRALEHGCISIALVLLLLVLLALVAATNVHEVYAQQSERRVALVIANADYPDGEGALKEMAGNTRAFADELKRQGFEVDVGDNLTKQAMRASIERFYGKIKPDSRRADFFQRTWNSIEPADLYRSR